MVYREYFSASSFSPPFYFQPYTLSPKARCYSDMTTAADLSDDGGRSEPAVTRCGSCRDEVAEEESPPGGAKNRISLPAALATDDAGVDDVTREALRSIALLEGSERASLGGCGRPKG